MSTTYESAPEVADVVLSVAQEDHPELLLAPIVAVFRSPPAKSKGRVKLASVKPIQGLPAYLVDALGAEVFALNGRPVAGSFFVIEVSKDHWKELNESAQRALIDHELCHIDWAGPDEPIKTRAHDLEEFTAVVKRHGLWRTSVYDLVAAGAEQLQFDIERFTDTDE